MLFDRLIYKNTIYIIYQFENKLVDYHIDKNKKLYYNQINRHLDSSLKYQLKETIERKRLKKFTGILDLYEPINKKKIKARFIKGELIGMRTQIDRNQKWITEHL